MNRGFVVLFVPYGADIAKPENHKMIASVGNDEIEVATQFNDQFSGQRQLLGIISLEEIETHHALIMGYAAELGIDLDRLPAAASEKDVIQGS